MKGHDGGIIGDDKLITSYTNSFLFNSWWCQ